MIRPALWGSAFYNAIAGMSMALPASVGAFFGLPLPAPRFYAGFVAMFVLLFAGLYAWLARQPVIHRPLIAFAAIGKASAFTLTLVFLALGDISIKAASGAVGDLVFAIVFAWWLSATRADRL